MPNKNKSPKLSNPFQLKYPSRQINPVTNTPIWRERFATVYKLTPEHGRWTEDPHITYILFFEENGLLKPLDLFLYNLYRSRAGRLDREKTPLHLEELAKKCGIRKESIVESNDRLQDAFLIHKLCRLDLRGQPHDIVVHAPPTRKQWNEYLGERIIERLKTEETRLDREYRMKPCTVHKENPNGTKKSYETLTRDRANCCPPEYRVNFKQILALIGGTKRQQDEFISTILDLIFYLAENNENLIHIDKEFRKFLAREFDRYEIIQTQDRWTAAFELRRIYAPMPIFSMNDNQ